MTKASIIAFGKPENKERRKSHKKIIHEFLKWNHTALFVGLTAPEISSATGLSEASCFKRCSDLHREGKLEIIDTKAGFSVYRDANKDAKMTTPQAFKVAVGAYCDADTASAIFKFVKNNTL